jgi:hypothetical protein
LLPSPNNAACAPEGTQPNASGCRKNYASQSHIDWTRFLMKLAFERGVSGDKICNVIIK